MANDAEDSVREYPNVTLKGESTPGTLAFDSRRLGYKPGSEEGSKLKVKWSRVVECKKKKAADGGHRLKIMLDDEQVLVFEFASKDDFENAREFASDHTVEPEAATDPGIDDSKSVSTEKKVKDRAISTDMEKELKETKRELADLKMSFQTMERDMQRLHELFQQNQGPTKPNGEPPPSESNLKETLMDLGNQLLKLAGSLPTVSSSAEGKKTKSNSSSSEGQPPKAAKSNAGHANIDTDFNETPMGKIIHEEKEPTPPTGKRKSLRTNSLQPK